MFLANQNYVIFVGLLVKPNEMQQDNYTHPDYFLMDELLSEEHKIIRDSVRTWVKQKLSPVINDYAQKSEFPK